MPEVRCASCLHRLSRANTQPEPNANLLLCTNCGNAFLEWLLPDGKTQYKYLGATNGNNEVRELLNLEVNNNENNT